MVINGEDVGVRVTALLQRLEAHWRFASSTILEKLRPGLTDAEIDEVTAPWLEKGFVVPAELRALYRWHDGSDSFTTFAPGDWFFASLQELVQWYDQNWRTNAVGMFAEALDGEDPEKVWPSWWVPILIRTGEQSSVLIDARPHDGNRAVAWSWVLTDGYENRLQQLSFISLLENWLLWFDGGYLSFDQENESWDHDGRLHWTTLRACFC